MWQDKDGVNLPGVQGGGGGQTVEVGAQNSLYVSTSQTTIPAGAQASVRNNEGISSFEERDVVHR